MAKIFYQLCQNKNEDAIIYGKWFAHAESVETMSCLVEMLLESKFEGDFISLAGTS